MNNKTIKKIIRDTMGIEKKQLPPDYNPDKFQWTKANLVNTLIPPNELESIRDNAWEEFNSEEFKKSRKSWVAVS